jgi:hypothetical protein
VPNLDVDLPTGFSLVSHAERETNPIEIDRERDEGVYHDANVWVVHALS